MEHASIGRGATAKSTGAGRSAIAGRLLRALIALGVLGTGAGCTELADASETAEGRLAPGPDAAMTAVVEAAAPPPTGAWACTLGGTIDVAIAKPAPKKVRYRVVLVDFVLGPIPRVNIIACKALDVRCEAPVESVMTTFSPVSFQVEVPFSFDGYLRITSDDHITTDYSLGGPLVGSPAGTLDEDGTPIIVGEPIGIPTFKQLDDFTSGRKVGYVQDKNKGILAARTVDCNGKRATGVTLNIAPATNGIAYTLYSNSPVFSEPPSAPLPTDPRGVLGYVNMDPGNYQITGTLPEGITMPRVSSPMPSKTYGVRSVRINANTLTVAEIRTDEGYFVGR